MDLGDLGIHYLDWGGYPSTHTLATVSELEIWKVGSPLEELHGSRAERDPGVVPQGRRWEYSSSFQFILSPGQGVRGALEFAEFLFKECSS